MKNKTLNIKTALGVAVNDLKGFSGSVQYRAWYGMISRCYRDNGKGYRTYQDCSVHKDFLFFSKFLSWMEQQDWKGKQLDKDILIPGNKVYSPASCLFVDRHINAFFSRGNTSKTLPIGVSETGVGGGFVSQIQNPFTKKVEWLGNFSCPKQAHETWRIKKHQFALALAEKQTDQRVAKALRERFAPAI